MKNLPYKELETFFSKKEEINTAALFGSFAKDRVRRTSDVDIGVLLNHYHPVSWEYTSKLIVDLGDICHREVDVIILNEASPHLAFRIIKEGKILFQRNQCIWSCFVVKAIGMNEDIEILYRKVGRG